MSQWKKKPPLVLRVKPLLVLVEWASFVTTGMWFLSRAKPAMWGPAYGFGCACDFFIVFYRDLDMVNDMELMRPSWATSVLPSR